MRRYESYKDSGVEWLGKIPSQWELTIGMNVFRENKRDNKGMKEKTVLSLSYGQIIIKPEEKLVGLVPESFETYQIVEPNDIIIRCTDLQNDQTSLRTGLAKDKGIITSAYLNLKVINNHSAKFLHYYLHTLDITKVLYKFGSGLRQNLSFLDFKRLPIIDIPLSEQQKIAQFLDDKTAKIDQAVDLAEKQIALLKEHKQILIQNAVTRGLNPDVPLKDSGVKWIGQVPHCWDVKKVKNIFHLIVEPAAKNNQCELLSVYTDIGVKPRAELEERGNKASTTDGYWIVKKGDIVVNKLLAWMGAIGLSEYDGVTSPAYDILRPHQQINGKFFHYLFRTPLCLSEFKKNSRGIMDMRLRLYFEELGNIYIPFPSYPEQQKIAQFLDDKTAKIDQAITLKTAHIEKLKEYKSVLINDVVTGKMRVSV